MEELINFSKQYGFVFSGSEIYGGLSNTYDYGPVGALLKNNIKDAYIQKFAREDLNNVLIDAAIFMNPKVWEASGHLASFSDPLMDCKNCKTRHRADKLIEEFDNDIEAGGWEDSRYENYIKDNNLKCPKCGSDDFTNIRKFNLMFKTHQGVTEDSQNIIYLRPETAQGIFVNFKNVERSMRLKVPFGICQIGKSFRNEITPGNFIFRTREFEQMELQFFVKPGNEMKWFKHYEDYILNFLYDLGIKKENIRLREHTKDELSMYSNKTIDVEYKFPFGFGELWGIASRTDYDLGKHMEYSKEDLRYLDPVTNEKYIPYVIEPSVGVDRLFLTVLSEAYTKETVNDQERIVLKLNPFLAPYKVAVLPLSKKYHSEKAKELYKSLSKHFDVTYDESGSIGKRYRRQDAIGTPFVITVDDNTLENSTVTLRHRDSMEQDELKECDIITYINENITL